jgi:succinate-semialdehyde dehydrogenase/glutarate-semialdehyde dehydrogenase
MNNKLLERIQSEIYTEETSSLLATIARKKSGELAKHTLDGRLDRHAALAMTNNANADDVLYVTNPFNGDIVGSVNMHDTSDVDKAVNNAQIAMKDWMYVPARDKASLLLRWYDLVVENCNELAQIITYENGKTIQEAKGEVMYGARFIEWFAYMSRTIQGSVSEGINKNQRIMTSYEPIGVVAALTPWNFPSAMVARKVAPAIAAGCSVVLKPSELTPLSALALQLLAKDADIPDGVLNIVTGDAKVLSRALIDHPNVRKLTFTGSTRVGRMLYEQAARGLKKVSLELGGNAPFMVCDDANLEQASSDLVSGKIRSTGQACTSPNRILIHEAVYDHFIEKLYSKFSCLKVGNGFDDDVNIGPMITCAAVERVMDLIQDAINDGAQMLCGGRGDGSSFLLPTLLQDCTDQMRIFDEEIFGPVLACYKVKNINEMITLANKSNYGLASYVYTTDYNTAWKINDSLDYGIVGINQSIVSNEIGAFGGRKDSGIGIEGSTQGIYEFMVTKYTCFHIKS